MAEQKAGVDVLAVLDEVVRRVDDAMPSPLNLRGESAMHPVHHADYAQEIREARAAAAELIEAHRESVLEIVRLRGAMFRVYAVTANGGDPTAAIEQMRDAMDCPWSVDRSRAALARCGGA